MKTSLQICETLARMTAERSKCSRRSANCGSLCATATLKFTDTSSPDSALYSLHFFSNTPRRVLQLVSFGKDKRCDISQSPPSFVPSTIKNGRRSCTGRLELKGLGMHETPVQLHSRYYNRGPRIDNSTKALLASYLTRTAARLTDSSLSMHHSHGTLNCTAVATSVISSFRMTTTCRSPRFHASLRAIVLLVSTSLLRNTQITQHADRFPNLITRPHLSTHSQFPFVTVAAWRLLRQLTSFSRDFTRPSRSVAANYKPSPPAAAASTISFKL